MSLRARLLRRWFLSGLRGLLVSGLLRRAAEGFGLRRSFGSGLLGCPAGNSGFGAAGAGCGVRGGRYPGSGIGRCGRCDDGGRGTAVFGCRFRSGAGFRSVFAGLFVCFLFGGFLFGCFLFGGFLFVFQTRAEFGDRHILAFGGMRGAQPQYEGDQQAHRDQRHRQDDQRVHLRLHEFSFRGRQSPPRTSEVPSNAMAIESPDPGNRSR